MEFSSFFYFILSPLLCRPVLYSINDFLFIGSYKAQFNGIERDGFEWVNSNHYIIIIMIFL